MTRLAANLSMLFQDLPLQARYAAARSCGFAGVEMLFPYEAALSDIADWRRAAGVAQVLFNAPPGDWAAGERGIASFPERRAEFRGGIETALRYAEALECRQVHVMAGTGAGVVRDCYVENLGWAAGRAAEAGVRILIEPLNLTDNPGYALSDTGEAERILAEVGASNLMLQYDQYHMFITGELSLERVAELLPVIAHVQIADVPGRHEPGSGEVDIPGLLEHLDGLGYAGWVGCEYRPAGDTRAGLGWARRWLDRE